MQVQIENISFEVDDIPCEHPELSTSIIMACVLLIP